MRIAIVGAGGVGGFWRAFWPGRGRRWSWWRGAASSRPSAGRGCGSTRPWGAFTARVAAAEDPAALPPAEAVLVAVKAWQVKEVAPRLAPLLAPGAVVVPLQNGVEAADQLARRWARARWPAGWSTCSPGSTDRARVKHVGDPPEVTMGELPGGGGRGGAGAAAGPRLEALAAALRGAGAAARVVDDVQRAIWEKFLLVEPWGAVAAAARAPIGVLRSVPRARALCGAAMEEVAALAAPGAWRCRPMRWRGLRRSSTASRRRGRPPCSGTSGPAGPPSSRIRSARSCGWRGHRGWPPRSTRRCMRSFCRRRRRPEAPSRSFPRT